MYRGDYEEIKEKIKQSQQQFQFQSEIIGIVVIMGLIINISSSLIYDLYLSKYTNSFSLLLIMFFLIIVVVFVFTRYFSSSDSQIQILHYSHDLLSENQFEAGIEREIRGILKKNGISINECNDIYDKFERSIKKILSEKKIYEIGKKVIKIINHEGSVNEIIIDISKNDIDAQMNIKLTPFRYPTFFNESEENMKEFYDMYLELDCYINNSRHKSSLIFFDDFIKRQQYLIDVIKSVLVLILGYNWGLIDKQSTIYHMVRFLDLD